MPIAQMDKTAFDTLKIKRNNCLKSCANSTLDVKNHVNFKFQIEF